MNSYRSICGESTGIHSETIQGLIENILPCFTQQYSSENILNDYEAGFFNNLVIDKNFAAMCEICCCLNLFKLRLVILYAQTETEM